MQISKPRRVRHHYTQSLVASPDRVFPLLCPVRETDWAPGWMPDLVISESGVMEEMCLFVTPDKPAESIWINTHHDPLEHQLVLWKVIASHSACKLEISLRPQGDDRSLADITYTCTALGSAGDDFLKTLTPDWYRHDMQHWEQALNYYLENGTMIAGE